MKISSIVVSCLLLSAHFTYAQTTELVAPKPKSRLYLSDLYIQTGMMNVGSLPLNLADYKRLAPGSVLLKDDFSTFSTNNQYQQRSVEALFSVLAGINFSNKPNWQLRVGFTTFRDYTSSLNYSKSTRKAYDTLVSAQTGKQYFIDSVNTKNYSMQHARQQIRAEASLIYRTNPERRWSFYAGVGASIFFTLQSRTDIGYFQYASQETRTNSDYSNTLYYASSFRYNDGIRETYSNKNTVGYSAFMPIGVDFRLGKTHSVWSKIHLLYEIRPSVSFTKTAETKRIATLDVQQNLGLRFVLAGSTR